MKDLVKRLQDQLNCLPNTYDLSDLGNIVGYEVALFCSKNPDMFSDIGEFEWGFAHGVSLVNGTY